MQVQTAAELSECIDIQRGTIQGDTMSPFLLLVLMQPLLAWLDQGNHGYEFHSAKAVPLPQGPAVRPPELSNPAFADDVVLATQTTHSLQRQIYKLHAWCQWTRMELGIKKCAITGLSFSPRTAQPLNASELQAQMSSISFRGKDSNSPGQSFPFLGPHDAYKYLGVWISTGLDWTTQYNKTITKLNSWGNNVLKLSWAKPEQRLRMITQKLQGSAKYTALSFCFSDGQLSQIENTL